jgi:hypothetical protein
VIAFFERLHAGPDIDDDAGPLVAQNGGKETFGVRTRERELVGVTDSGRPDFDQHFAGARPFEVDRFDRERCACLVGDRGFDFHGRSLTLLRGR